MALGCEMEIDHGGVQAVMAEVLLDATDVNTGFQEMSGPPEADKLHCV